MSIPESQFITWYLNTFNYANPNPVGKGAGTPYYRYWEMGVNVPIPNAHLTYPKKIRELLQTQAASGQTAVVLAEGSSALAGVLANNLQSLGLAKISRADDSGSEIVEIQSATAVGSNVNLVLVNNLANTYPANSVFLYYSTMCADQWNSLDPLLVTKGLIKGFPADLNYIDGKTRAQQLNIASGSIGTTPRLFQCTLQSDIYRYLSTAYTYRLGAKYYVNWGALTSGQTAGAIIALQLSALSTPQVMNLYYFDNLAADLNKYYLFNGLISSSFIGNLRQQLYLNLSVAAGGTLTAGQTVVIGLDDIYWEHSAGVENQMGCILLPNSPSRDSLDIGWSDENMTSVVVSNNDKYNVFPNGSPNYNRKYKISGTFESVPIAIFNKMKIMEQYQNDGFNINLHTHLNELPQVLTGRLTIASQKKNVFDFTRTSFDFIFEEN